MLLTRQIRRHVERVVVDDGSVALDALDQHHSHRLWRQRHTKHDVHEGLQGHSCIVEYCSRKGLNATNAARCFIAIVGEVVTAGAAVFNPVFDPTRVGEVSA